MFRSLHLLSGVIIAGVVAPVRSTTLAAESRETVYVPYFFAAFLPPTFVVRTAVDAADRTRAKIGPGVAAEGEDPRGRSLRLGEGQRFVATDDRRAVRGQRRRGGRSLRGARGPVGVGTARCDRAPRPQRSWKEHAF